MAVSLTLGRLQDLLVFPGSALVGLGLVSASQRLDSDGGGFVPGSRPDNSALGGFDDASCKSFCLEKI